MTVHVCVRVCVCECVCSGFLELATSGDLSNLAFYRAIKAVIELVKSASGMSPARVASPNSDCHQSDRGPPYRTTRQQACG